MSIELPRVGEVGERAGGGASPFVGGAAPRSPMPWRQPALAPLFNLSERRSSNAQDSGTEGFSLPVPAFEPASAGELPALATSTSSTRPTLVARAEARPSPPPVRLNTARVATRGSGAGGSSSFHSGRGRAHPGGAQETQKKLGMLNGVLIPTCENMWGVLIFLRFYAIVGSAGLGLTFLIVALSFLVALCTSLSLSAIATCGTSHKLQGVYPLLARALGKEMASAIGCVYFVGIILNAVLEVLGAVELLFEVQPQLASLPGAVQLWGSTFVALLSVLVLGGTRLISSMGLLFGVIVLLTILSYYISLLGAPYLGPPQSEFALGLSASNLALNGGPAYQRGESFASNLSLFFPCFCGFLSGANRASALQSPQTAIPLGTLGAVCTSLCLYLSFFLLWAAVGERAFLAAPSGQLDALIWPSVRFVRLGIILTSLGQALQCLTVAPKLLQTIAADRVIRPLAPFARLAGRGGEPRRALLAAYIVGASAVLIGSLDLVAPLLSMCFLLCYASMNLNCFFLAVLQDPHWRPKWRYFHWSVGLLGFGLSVALMFTIQFAYALVAWAAVGLIFAYILRTNAQRDFGSALHGLRFKLAMRALLAVDMEQHLKSSWKPQLLLLYQLQEEDADGGGGGGGGGDGGGGGSGDGGNGGGGTGDAQSACARAAAGHTHTLVLSLAHQLRHGSGLVIAAAIIPLLDDEGEDDARAVAYAESEKAHMAHQMKRIGIEGFPMTVLTRDAAVGKAYAIQCAGLGPLTPNTVLMGWPCWWRQKPGVHAAGFVSICAQCSLSRKAMLIANPLQDFPTERSRPLEGYIDVWWIKHDGGLLLLIAHLLKQHRLWRRCPLRLHLVTESGTNPSLIKERMHRLLSLVNISATVEEVILVEPESLLPYMLSSDTRLRNQETAAKLTGRDASVKGNVAAVALEELIVAPLPLQDEESELRAVVAPGQVGRRPARTGRELSAGAHRVEVVDMREGASASSCGGAAGRRTSIPGSLAGSDSGDVPPPRSSRPAALLLPRRMQSAPTLTQTSSRYAHGVPGVVSELRRRLQTPVHERKGRASHSDDDDDDEEEEEEEGDVRSGSDDPGPAWRGDWREGSSRGAMDGRSGSAQRHARRTDASPLPLVVSPPPSPPFGAQPLRTAARSEPPRSPEALLDPPPSPSPPDPPAPQALAQEQLGPLGSREELAAFIRGAGLDAAKAAELERIFERSISRALLEPAAEEPVAYEWSQMHNLVASRSQNSQLVLINLPDPPDVKRGGDGEYSAADHARMLEYMEYLDRMASGLPRVLFVHGAGQEVVHLGE